ncbi:hypothetical protein BDY24DRAFT_414518 [Mrakia frigida]|uniref:DUF6534 domain-containing protein n=1 Tax=Mrakia frigida TaxID=29902 RepID=UPI003FCC1617
MSNSTEVVVDTGLAALWASDPVWYVGGLALASSLDQILFGILCIEVWSYFHWFRKDRRNFKILVCLLFIINLGQTCVTLVYGFLVFVKEVGNWPAINILVNVEWEICLAYFLDRAYKISKKNKYLLVFCSVTILGGVGLGLGSSIATIIAGNDVNFSNFTTLTNLVIIWKTATGVTDLVLTSTIVYHLLKSKSEWTSTNATITSLVRFTFEAQCLPLIAGLFFLATYVYDGNSNLCLIGSFSETKLAAISVLHVLNSRGKLRHDWSGTDRSTEKNTSGNYTTRVTGGGTKGVAVFTETQIHSSAPDEFDPHPTRTQTRSQRRLEDEDGISLESFEHDAALKEQQAKEGESRGPFASEVSFAGTDDGRKLINHVDLFPYKKKD